MFEASKISAATIEKTSQPVQKPQKIVEKPKKSGGNLKNHLEINREIIPIFKISEMKFASVFHPLFDKIGCKSAGVNFFDDSVLNQKCCRKN